MKNPRVYPHGSLIGRDAIASRLNGAADGSVEPATFRPDLAEFGPGALNSADQLAVPVLDAKSNGLESALKFLKLQPEEIERITQLVGTVATLASVVGWVTGGVTTVKSLLSLLGVLDPEKDANRELLEKINQKVETIYAYLEAESNQRLYREAIDWRTDVSRVRNSLGNLAISRAPGVLDAAVRNTEDLQSALEKMLAPKWAEIPFVRATQGYHETFPHSHWVDAALPAYMTRADGTPVDYQDKLDLGATIWDPGYYLDVLFEGIGVRIAALAAIEPAFRSTGYDRNDLRALYRGLGEMIDAWNASFIRTNVVGPIDPLERTWHGPPFMLGTITGHVISHPFQWPTQTILVGAVDPASGIAAIEDHGTGLGDGFDLAYIPGSQSQVGGFWVTQDFQTAVKTSTDRTWALYEAVRAKSLINKLYDLRASIGQLISGHGPEFVELSDPTMSFTPLRPGGAETVDLGLIGSFAGKPGKKYAAARFFRETSMRFRIPMARRMDESGIQLGYELTVDVGGANGTAVIRLCDYSHPAEPKEQLPLFPTGTRHGAIQTTTGSVYDVYQSSLLSTNGEEVFETNGTPPAGAERLYLNPRSGPVHVEVDVSFSFDPKDPDSPFIGFADVEIRNVGAEAARDGFIANVSVSEMVVSPVTDTPQWELADQMALHFAPSFLVVDPAYFVDRAAGLHAMNEILGGINEKYVRAKTRLGPLEPIERIRREAVEQDLAISSFAEVQRRAPELAASVLRRFDAPEVARAREIEELPELAADGIE